MSVADKKLIVVAGPTAVGKTAYAIHLAKELNTEIISFDSRQFYKEMEIGVAVPSQAELQEIPHHFIQHISIQDNYNAGKFELEALNLLEILFQKYNVVVAVGGSGMYLNALLYGFDPLPSDANIRNELQLLLQEKGIEALQAELQQLDPAYFEIVDQQNPHRLIRALEICKITGKTYSSQRQNKPKERNFSFEIQVLQMEREKLYQRINQRVDKMMEAGLLEEVKILHPFKSLNSLQTVGYRELFDYLEQKTTLPQAIEAIKQNSRRYAKRQITWFKQYENPVVVNL